MGANGNGRVRFDHFEFDPQSGQLLRDGQPLRVQPQPLRVLQVLLEHAGQTVSRDALRERIWGDGTYVEFDEGLNYCIRQIRVALGDNAAKPAYVETLPKQGYRFLAAVVHANGNGAGLAPTVSASLHKTRRGRWMLVAAACIIAVVAAAGISLARKPHIASLAVLPLNNFSGDSGQDYYADGMTDELTTMLAKNSTLRIASRTSAMQYRNAHRPLPEIAKNLGVDGILEGSVARSGNRVHVTVQLIDGRRDAHIWAESFDRDWHDSAALSREVAQWVAKQLHSAVAPPAAARYVRPEAHDAYLHGRYLWFGGRIDEAGQYFQQAVDLQPDYALAWTGVESYYGGGAVEGLLAPQDALQRGKAAALRADSLDDALAEAHVALCAEAFFADWNWPKALQECDRAIELNPKITEAYHLKAKVMATLGRHDEAIQLERKVMELSPFERRGGYTERPGGDREGRCR